MFNTIISLCIVIVVYICIIGGCTKETQQKAESHRLGSMPQPASTKLEKPQTGEVLFKQYCFSCHPDGGNVTDAKRTLHASSLRANNISNPEDIIKIMRKPISRMIRFDTGTISDKEARIIAEYVLDTFK